MRRRELGGIEPHQRGEGLRHPVGDHRHGAEHDADLQQRHRHLRIFLCALLGPDSSRLHSTDSGEKQGRRVASVPTAASCFTRVSGSSALFLDISDRSTGVGRGRNGRSGKKAVGTKVKPKHLIQCGGEEEEQRCWRQRQLENVRRRASSSCLVPHNCCLSTSPLLFRSRPTVRLLPWCAL